MKKLIKLLAFAAFAAALALLPFHAADAAKLLPVKTVVVTRSGDEYIIDVGAGVRAVGRSISEALTRLREEVAGLVFLPTAEQVVITEPAEEAAADVAAESAFRPAAGIFRTPEPEPDPASLSAWLEAHPSGFTVLDLRAALAAGERPRIPRLLRAEGGWRVDGQD